MPSQTNITNIPSSRVDFIDQRTGLMSREWYRFFLNLFNLTGAGNNPTSLDDLQVGPPTGSGEGGGSGSVTSVEVSGGTTGLTTSGGPITSAGTITFAGTLVVANGGTGATTAGGARTNLGASTVGSNMFTLTNPSAVTFPQFNADNTISALNAASFRTAIGAGTGAGSVTSVDATGGTGISVSGGPITTSGTLTITNTAPDQVVSLTGAGTTAVTGTYPNFTITSNDAYTGTVTSVGTAGTVNGLTLTGGPITSSGTITLGGTLDLSSPPTIGNTAPNTGTFTTLIGGGGSANYGQLTGGATTKAVEFKSLGSDTNVALALRTQGTGAIDLAAGSRGVNISNGGTVTAITGTAGGSYTVVPTITISAPTTAGGVQATGTVGMSALTTALASGGTGYAIGDTITLTGGTFTQAIVLTVATLSGSAVATFTTNNAGTYSVLPTNPVAQGSTSGGGSGATFNITAWQVRTTAFTITNAGSGYVEQPTVTFSSGSAAAYASVGSAVGVKTIHGSIGFYGPQNTLLFAADTGNTAQCYMNFQGSNSNTINYANGTASNVGIFAVSKGSGQHSFTTNGSTSTEQLRVAHTASAVNYVQVTGAATTGLPQITAQGSDTNPGLLYITKGIGEHRFASNASGGNIQFRVRHTASAVNYGTVTGAAAGASPEFAVLGTDTNIDLTLTPKGTGQTKAGGSALNATNGIIINAQTVNTDCTVAATDNAMSIGPITVASGKSVTVSSGSRWVVI
jgi:hypothetical protein